jgi:WD40 repeat protein
MQIYSVLCNSDINIWGQESEFPVSTLRGHQNNVTKVINFGDKYIISADQDGRILYWNPETFSASRPSGIYKLPIQVCALSCNSDFVYAGSADMNIIQYKVDESGLTSTKPLTKKHSSALQMIATTSLLYVLYTDKSI